MSLVPHGMVRCDICGQTQPEAVLRLKGWERLFRPNPLGVPEHACSAACTLYGRHAVAEHLRSLAVDPATPGPAPQKPLHEGGLGTRYAPPYDSPLEDRLAWQLDKYLSSSVAIIPQYVVDTMAGRFRLDFALELGGRRWGLECDGAEFHTDQNRDEWRDAMILATGDVDSIYRFQGKDLVHHTNACVALLAEKARCLFSERGLLNLDRLTHDIDDDLDLFTDDQQHQRRARGQVHMKAWDRAYLNRPRPPFWKRYIDFVAARAPATLEDHMAAFSAHADEQGIF